MIPAGPDLVVLVLICALGMKCEGPQQPVPATFRLMLNGCNQFLRTKGFEISKGVTQVSRMGLPDHMHVIGHDHIGAHGQSFIQPAIAEVFNQDVPVDFSAEKINPVNYSEGHKEKSKLVADFVSAGEFIVHSKEFRG